MLPTLDVAGQGRAEEAGRAEGLDGPIRPVLKPVLLLAFPAEEAGVTSLCVTEGEAQKPRRGSWNLRREATAQPRRVRLAGFGSRCTRTSLTLRASRCISVRPGAHQCVLVRPSASQSIQCPARVWDGRRGGSVRVRAVCWPGRPDADPGCCRPRGAAPCFPSRPRPLCPRHSHPRKRTDPPPPSGAAGPESSGKSESRKDAERLLRGIRAARGH